MSTTNHYSAFARYYLDTWRINFWTTDRMNAIASRTWLSFDKQVSYNDSRNH